MTSVVEDPRISKVYENHGQTSLRRESRTIDALSHANLYWSVTVN
jgi:hypothetical protein